MWKIESVRGLMATVYHSTYTNMEGRGEKTNAVDRTSYSCLFSLEKLKLAT